MNASSCSFDVHPEYLPLDPAFQPLARALSQYEARVASVPDPRPAGIALERTQGETSCWSGLVLPPDPAYRDETLAYLRRILKFLLWAQGGSTVYLDLPIEYASPLADLFAPGGPLRFDAELMQRAFDRPFRIEPVRHGGLPSPRATAKRIGGHRNGCRLGFDLGASDFKVAAVRDGEVLFSAEIPWTPSKEPDPDYHYQKLNEGLRRAAEALPRVDAIGGSSAGIIVDNQVMVASLFRAVPAQEYGRARRIFLRLQEEWGVPVEVANDGDVTALAGALSLGRNNILGIAMGSSEAAGFIDAEGRILGWLNELAFAPVDARADAPIDEWSGARGVGAQYFSQQAVNRLLPAAGIEAPAEMPLPERLVMVQRLAAEGDPRAERIFRTIGGYLGYTLPLYHRMYGFGDVLVLGRVTSGRGGEILLETARRVLESLYGERGAPFAVRVPDEKFRRVGQAVAAASLPLLHESVTERRL